MNKTIPEHIDFKRVAEEFGTPVHVYDMRGIQQTTANLAASFSNLLGYRNYFAVKATPTPKILRYLVEQGMGLDCSSKSELLIAQKIGVNGRDIFYSSNNTPKEDFELAIELGATVNIDDLVQVPVFISALGEGKSYDRVALRYNPGGQQSGNSIIGKPKEAKYGMSFEQMTEAYDLLSKSCEIEELGLHIMAVSNERDPSFFERTAELMRKAYDDLAKKGVDIKFINLGGGLGIPYEPEEEPIDLAVAGQVFGKHLADLEGVEIYTENGRFVTGPNGYLLTEVRYVMDKHKKYIGVDASMNNLMRPGMYGAYHHISVLGEHSAEQSTYDVSGSLCENNDKFAVNRQLPADVKQGDLLLMHDTGAHGHAMGFNYNGMLRSPEVLAYPNGELELARRAETFEDYTSTVVWPK